jgi:hypothetical protein
VLAAALLATAAVLAACSTNAPSSARPTGKPVGPVATASAVAPASFGPPPSPTPDDAAPVVLDETLLAILPTEIGSTPVKEDLDAAALALSDPALDQVATAIDAGVAFDGGNGDLVLALVVRLKPGAFGEEVFRQWRDSFDDGACAPSGGVVGHAESDIGGRKTYVTSCVEGMHTYHVWLQDQGLLVSASSIGDGRFGEELVKGLRVPS